MKEEYNDSFFKRRPTRQAHKSKYHYSPNSYTNLNGNTYYDYRQTSKSYSTDEIQQLIDSLVDDPDWWDYFTNPPKENHSRIESNKTSSFSEDSEESDAYCYVNNISVHNKPEQDEDNQQDDGIEADYDRRSSSKQSYFIEEDYDIDHYCQTDNDLIDYLEQISSKQRTNTSTESKLTKSKKKLNLFVSTSGNCSQTTTSEEKIKLSKSDSAVSECSSFDDDDDSEPRCHLMRKPADKSYLSSSSSSSSSLSSVSQHRKQCKSKRSTSNSNNLNTTKPTPLILLKTKNNNKLIGILKKKHSSTTTILVDKYKHSDVKTDKQKTKNIIIKLVVTEDMNQVKDDATRSKRCQSHKKSLFKNNKIIKNRRTLEQKTTKNCITNYLNYVFVYSYMSTEMNRNLFKSSSQSNQISLNDYLDLKHKRSLIKSETNAYLMKDQLKQFKYFTVMAKNLFQILTSFNLKDKQEKKLTSFKSLKKTPITTTTTTTTTTQTTSAPLNYTNNTQTSKFTTWKLKKSDNVKSFHTIANKTNISSFFKITIEQPTVKKLNKNNKNFQRCIIRFNKLNSSFMPLTMNNSSGKKIFKKKK